jgi:hypothetical protein
MTVIISNILNVSGQTGDTFGTTINLGSSTGFAIEHVVTDQTTGADAFLAAAVTVADDTITTADHGMYTGAKGQMTTDSADLPSGLSLATDYFVIRVDSDNYQLATSLVNATAGTAVDLVDIGTGTHTFTPIALSGTVTYQRSVDGVVWTDLSTPAPNAFTGTETVFSTAISIYHAYIRLKLEISDGTASVYATINAKGV